MGLIIPDKGDKVVSRDGVENRVVVRLDTTTWYDGKSLHIKRSLYILKRKSTGFNFFEEDLSCAGAPDVMRMLINLDECEDGVYKIIPCNFGTDWESGITDMWDYKLIPFKEYKDDRQTAQSTL